LWLLTGAAGFALTMLIPLVIMPRLNTNADVLLQILPLAAQIITSAACAVHVERSLK
jgi:hypothetical protein